MEKERVFTLSEVARHNSKQDCWLIISGRVMDVTKWLEEHPGGEEVLIESAGKDASKEFKDIGHTNKANVLLLDYQIGYLHGHQPPHSNHASSSSLSCKELVPDKEMKAFKIKEDPKPKYAVAAFMEFFVPILVAASSFAYLYLT